MNILFIQLLVLTIWKWSQGIFSDLFIHLGQLISLKQCETGPLNDLIGVMLILAHAANIQDVLNCDFYFSCLCCFSHCSAWSNAITAGLSAVYIPKCQNTKSLSKLVSPQPNGSQTLFHRRFHCSALSLALCVVNRRHVQMQLTLAARCFVLSSLVILFDPHVRERLLTTCDQRLLILKWWSVVSEKPWRTARRTFHYSSTNKIFWFLIDFFLLKLLDDGMLRDAAFNPHPVS